MADVVDVFGEWEERTKSRDLRLVFLALMDREVGRGAVSCAALPAVLSCAMQ